MVWFDPNAGPGWADYFGLLLGVVGFIIAWRQLRKTRKASEAVVFGLDAAQKRLVGNQALGLESDLAEVHADLMTAADWNNVELARRALLKYSRVAERAASVLEDVSGDHLEFVTHLRASSAEALDSKAMLYTPVRPDEEPPTVVLATMEFAKTLEATLATMAGIVGKLRNERPKDSANVHN